MMNRLIKNKLGEIMNIIPIPLYEDNYCYAVYQDSCPFYSLIDPAHFQGVTSFVSAHSVLSRLSLSAVFFTHKHWDHAGDSAVIASLYPNIPIMIGEADHVRGCTRDLSDNEIIQLEGNITVRCLHVPCHTRGHMLYYFTCGEKLALFTGDTLFIGGCGSFFEGNATDMHRNFERIRSLPGHCEIYCGHEYTVWDLDWASKVDLGHTILTNKLKWAKEKRERNEPTVPSTVASEIDTNPYMRAGILKQALGCNNDLSAFQKIRVWMNEEKTLV